MNQQMTPIPASQQVAQVTQQLTQALVECDDLQTALDAQKEKIRALRNVLAGVGIGQKLAAEQAQAVNKPAAAPTP